LIFTNTASGIVWRSNFNVQEWKPALAVAGLIPTPDSRIREGVRLRTATRDARPSPLLRVGPPGRGREHQGRERIPRALREHQFSGLRHGHTSVADRIA
jgi:hypothetical protein